MPEARKGDTTDTRAHGGQSTGGGGHGGGLGGGGAKGPDEAKAQSYAQFGSPSANPGSAGQKTAEKSNGAKGPDEAKAQSYAQFGSPSANPGSAGRSVADNSGGSTNNGGNTQSAATDTGRGRADSGPRGEDRSSDGPTQSAAAPNPANGQGGNQPPSQTTSNAPGGQNQNPQGGNQTAEATNNGPTSPPGEEDHGDNRSPWPSAPPSGGPEQVMLVQSETPESEASNAGRSIEVDLADLLQEQYTPEELAERSDASAGEEGEGRSIGGRILWGSDDPTDPRLYDMDVDELTALANDQRFELSVLSGVTSLLVADLMKPIISMMATTPLGKLVGQTLVGSSYSRVVNAPLMEGTNAYHEHVLGQPIVDENPGLLSERMVGDILPGIGSTGVGILVSNAVKGGVGSLLGTTALAPAAPLIAGVTALVAGAAAASWYFAHVDQAWQNYRYDLNDPADVERYKNNLTPEELQDFEDSQALMAQMNDWLDQQAQASLDLEALQQAGPTLAEPTSPLREAPSSADAIREITNYLNGVEDSDEAIVVAEGAVPGLSDDGGFDFSSLEPTYNPASGNITVEDGEIIDLPVDQQPDSLDAVQIAAAWEDSSQSDGETVPNDVIITRAEARNGDGEEGGRVPWWLLHGAKNPEKDYEHRGDDAHDSHDQADGGFGADHMDGA